MIAHFSRPLSMTHSATLALCTAAALIFLSTAAHAQDDLAPADLDEDLEEVEELAEEDDEAAAEEDEEQKPWSIGMSLRSVVGQGTFASPSNDTEWADHEFVGDGSGAWNRWNLVYSISPSYQLGDFNFGLNLSWVQWLTEAGGVGTTAGSGGANRAREFRFQDITGDVGWKSYTSERFDATITPGLSVRLPGSASSQTDTFRAEIGGSVSIRRNFFDDLTLIVGVSASRWFHEFTSPVLDIETIGVDNALYRPGEGEDVAPGRFSIGGYNLQYRVSPSLAASLTLPSDFSANISYGLHNYWTYSGPEEDDEFSSENMRAGRGFAQVTAASAGVSYTVNQWVSTSLSLTTIQPPKTTDNKSFRFPFWNFASPASNFSSVTFAVQGSY